MVLHTYDVETFQRLRQPVPDVYFTAEYGAAEEAAGSGRWIMLEAYEARWLMPVHIREGALATDAVSPYGYAGIYSSPDLTTAQALDAWSEACAALRDLSCVSVFVRQSPLITNGWAGPEGERVVRDHPTVQLDVRDVDEAWKRMLGRSRTSIRKAEKLGLHAAVRQALPQDLEQGSAFRRLYEAGMARRDASDRYLFTDDYYAKLTDGLGEDLLISEVHEGTSGEVVASSLLMRHAKQLHYHLSGSELEAGRKGATNALLWAGVRWAHDRGLNSFHLGGGLSPGDSLYKFKASFGGDVLSFNAFGVVVDDDAYTRATEARAKELGVALDEFVQREGAFPKYRSTL